ncbi:MAG: phosphatidylglycerophosphatase A [Gammaproteobacteria bacterium]|nr:phosphatidylglycerophosphatase A [Gammaproteobacteria bacterium]
MNNPITPAVVLRNPVHLLAFGFGSGLAPRAPGTVGTLAAIPIFLLLQPLSLALYIAVVFVALIAGIWICQRSSELLGAHDHPGIVWDEFVGYWITMVAAPPGWLWIVVGFVLFRLFDICKPWFIGVADRKLDGGLGIMLDDVLAGLFSCLILQALAWVWI